MRTSAITGFELPDTGANPDIDSRNGLWLTRRKERTCSKALLFVHGIGGHPTKSWGRFPEFAFAALEEFDLGYYGYTSAFLSNLVPLIRKPRLAAYAQEMRRAVWEGLVVKAGIDEIVFICHSLGGVIVKALVQQIEDDDVNRDVYFQRVHSVFFFGTPHFGSDRVRMIASRLSPLLAALKSNSRDLDRVRYFWRYRLAFEPHDHRPRRTLVHARAVYSDKDFWVDAESARGELEPHLTYPYRVKHARLVKPQHGEDGHFVYFANELKEIDELRDNGYKFRP